MYANSDFLTSAEMEMALFERDPPAVSACGRVPTRLRRVARWRQGIAALHSRASPEANGEAMRMGDASLSLSKGRVGTGDETPLPRRRQSDEKVSSPLPGKPLKTRPRSGSLNPVVVSARGHASGVMQRQDMPAPKGRDITVAVRGGGNFLLNRYSVMTRRELGCFQTIMSN